MLGILGPNCRAAVASLAAWASSRRQPIALAALFRPVARGVFATERPGHVSSSVGRGAE